MSQTPGKNHGRGSPPAVFLTVVVREVRGGKTIQARAPEARQAKRATRSKPAPRLEGPELARLETLQAIGQLSEAVQPTSQEPSIPLVAFINRTLDQDFLHFLPPAPKKSVLEGIQAAISGSFEKLRNLKEALSAEAAMGRALSQARLALDGPGEEARPLDRKERQALQAFFLGPLTQAVAGAGHHPTDLASLALALEAPDVRATLIELRKGAGVSDAVAEADVAAAIDVAKSVLFTMEAHFTVAVAEPSLLVGDGIPSERLAQLPDVLRFVLTDPALAPAAIAALKRGETISAQVLKEAPAHQLDDLREVSKTLAGGSFLWVDEFLRSKKRPHLTGGDVRRAKEAFHSAAEHLSKRAAAAAIQIRGELRDTEQPALDEALLQRSSAHLKALAKQTKGRDVSLKLARLASAFASIDELSRADPEAWLKTCDKKLDAFDAQRKQAVSIHVHGGSAQARGLEGRIRRHPRVERYRQAVLEHTVSAGYANHASGTAKDIVYGVAALSLVGIPIERTLGASAMSAILATAEDVLGWVGETTTLSNQGVPWRDILWGWRNAGLLPTLFLALGLAGHAETLAEAGRGGQAGLELAIGATALTIYTSLASGILFRQIGEQLVREGKVPDDVDLAEVRAALFAAARRATDALAGPEASVPKELEAKLDEAFSRLSTRIQGTPDGWALAREVGNLDPSRTHEELDAIARGFDDVTGLVRSAGDTAAATSAMAESVTQAFLTATAAHHLPVSPEKVQKARAQVEAALAGLGRPDVSPEQIQQAVARVLTVLLEATSKEPLSDTQRALVEQGAKKAGQEARALEAQLREQLKPELLRLARRFALDQVLANPVRRKLIEAVAIGIAISISVGTVAPHLLQIPLTVAVLGSMESIVAAVRLKLDGARHEHELAELGRTFLADEPAAADLIAQSIGPALS